MSERDSNQSSDNNKEPDRNNINTAPAINKQTDDPDSNTHAYFIPIVVLIVLGVIIVSTFYSKEFNNLIAGSAPHDQAEEPASEVTAHSLTNTQALDKPEDKAESNSNTETLSVTKVSDEVPTSIVETAVADSTLTTADSPSSETAAERALAPGLNNHVSMEDGSSYPDITNRDPYPYAPPMSYGMPQQQKAYNEMMEQRRSSYEEAMQARRDHMLKMHEYRAAVLKRIEQDRLDMHKRMQEIEQKHRRRLDKQMNRMELEDKHLMNHPV